MSLSEEDKQEFRNTYKKVTKESHDKIEDSACFMSPFTKEYIKDPLCMIQLGIAISLDKPIYLLFYPGVKIPRHLLRIASGWEQIKNDTKEEKTAAMERLMEKIKDGIK